MSDIELKPCPFCGGEAIIRTQIIQISDGVPAYQNARVECKKCRATSSTFIDKDNNGMHIFSVIEAWNRRVSE